jgi:hypothetical protein
VSGEREQIRGVYRTQLERMLELMANRIPTVMAAHRYAEEHARIYNRIGRNNLTEALSHLAGLAEGAEKLTEAEQQDELTNFEDHLRRTMMESFEVVAKARLGTLKRDGIWDRYYIVAARLVEGGKLPTVASRDRISELEQEIRYWMEEGRSRKNAQSWDGGFTARSACGRRRTRRTSSAAAFERRLGRQRTISAAISASSLV